MNRKKANGLLHGINFLLKTIHKEDPILNIMIVICIITSIGISFLSVYIPSLAVYVAERGSETQSFFALILLTIGFVVVSAVQNGVQEGRGMRQLFIGRSMLYQVFLSRMEHDYATIESEEGQQAYEKARQVCRWGADFRLLLEGMMDLFVCVSSFLLYSSILSMLNPVLIVFLLVLSGLNYLMLWRVNQANEAQREQQAGELRKYYYLINAFQNTGIGKDVRLYHMVSGLESRMDKSLNKLREIHIWLQKKVTQAQSVEGITALVRDAVAYTYLILQAVNGKISISEFVLYFGVISQFSNFIAAFMKSYGTLQIGCAGILAVEGYLQSAHPVSEDSLVANSHPANVSIEFRDVCFSYDGKTNVIDHLDLKICKGEKIALVGVNGAGKTTLIKLLCGLYKPQSGQIFMDGQPVESMNFTERLSYMAVIFQEHFILPYSIAENVSLCQLSETDEKYVEDCLEQAGLLEDIRNLPDGIRTQMTKAVSEDGISLSGGQQQKLLLARALYRKNASFWILDEPTASLDPIAESETYAQFHQLCGDRTCIYISHRLASTRFLDRIIILDGGKIVETGSHDELIRLNGFYARLFYIQSKYYKEGTGDENTMEAYQ